MSPLKLYLLCPQWGFERMDIELFLHKVKEDGYDGVDMVVPFEKKQRNRLRQLLEAYDLKIVSHQHQATGQNIIDFCHSYNYFLNLSAEVAPLRINSHSGRDYFSLYEHLKVLDTAAEFENNTGYEVVHETHRGRMLHSPGTAKELFDLRSDFQITADLSHWVCVTESYLENERFTPILNEAIRRTRHIHARVGFPEGPQVPDPRHPYYLEATQYFINFWSAILEYQNKLGTAILSVTPEFGPPPYMWTRLEDNAPVASQWEINLYIQQLFKKLLQVI